MRKLRMQPKNLLLENRSDLVLLGFLMIFFGLFLSLSFFRHDALKTQLNDLGNVEQALYNSLHGRFMYFSNDHPSDNPITNRLGGHANFILLLILPFYAIFQTPKLLLFIQVLIVSLGALPLYWLSKDYFKDKKLALIPPFVYLINPLVHDSTLYDFHPIVLAMSFIMFAFYFLHKKKFKWFYLFAFLIAISKEDMPLMVFMLGLYMFFVQKERRRGLAVSLVSFGYFILVTEFIMPFFSGGTQSAVLTQRYSYLGRSPLDMIKNLVLNPLLFFYQVFNSGTFVYVFVLLLPVFFLPLLSLEVLLLSIPSALINVLSMNKAMIWPFFFYYSAPILAFVFLSYTKALRRLLKTERVYFNLAVACSVATSVVYSFTVSPAPHSVAYSVKDYTVTPHAKDLSAVKPMIPRDASLSVQNNLGAHFSQRQFVYTFPHKSQEAEYVLVDINDPYLNPMFFPRQDNFVTTNGIFLDEYYEKVESLFLNEKYGVKHFSEEGYLLFERGLGEAKNQEARKMFDKNFSEINRSYKKFGLSIEI